MKRTNRKKMFLGVIVLAALVVTTVSPNMIRMEKTIPTARAASGSQSGIKIEKELTAKRSQFVKQFVRTDGSFTAVTYSMPVHYKKNGKWKEIDTTLIKSGKKNYKTKATDLSIKLSKKANKKSVVSLKRKKNSLSIALTGKKLKAAKAKISNPEKTAVTDVLNQNTVTYRNVLKNTNVSYDIFPEKIQEIISVTKKQKCRPLTFQLNSGKLKVKVKGKKVYFKTKQGKTKYTRLKTIVTDARGVSTTNAKVSYNKKKGTLTLQLPKKWWNSKKRKYPMGIRTTYTSDKHQRDVKVGAAYSGVPNSSFSHDKSLLLQANKCVAFTKMTTLTELGQPDVQIRGAALHVKNINSLSLGAGRTFDVEVHKVTEDWVSHTLTYNNRPAYEPEAAAAFGIQKKGDYQCDITSIVKAWYAGEANYGVALVADNGNRSYQAKLDRNPYFTVHYEIVGFDGAVQLTETTPVTRSVITAGQENYYYFDAAPGIAYDIYTDSSIDTQATMYSENKERVGYDDNSGLDKNILFTGAYDGRRYLKISVKDGGTGDYTLYMRKRFAVPETTGIRGQDKYTITWNAVEHAKEYLVCVYDGSEKISEAVVTGTSYDYVYTSATRGKTLGFTVTARESAALTGEASRMIYNTDSQSEWVYTTPMQEKRKNASTVSLDEKIYVLGGENANGSLKSFAVYDTGTRTWENLAEYPGTQTGICKAAVIVRNHDIYVIGGQTDTSANASLLQSVYMYDTVKKQWRKKANLAEGRTDLAAAVCGDKVYAWSKAGKTDRVDIYDLKTDIWETGVLPDTSAVIAAASVDNRVFVLKEGNDQMCWAEYLPDDNVFEEAGAPCPYTVSDKYGVPAVISGKIYLAKEGETKDVLYYDAYTDEWGEVSSMNLKKRDSALTASGNELYSIGGEMTGFGVLDTVEEYTIHVKTTKKEMLVNRGESYELQVTAGNLKKDQAQIVTVSVNPKELEILSASSFEEEEVLREGADGVTLLKYQPKKGVMVLKLTGNLERGESYETYHSIPVVGKIDGKTTVEITVEES